MAFKRRYHGHPWTDQSGGLIGSMCLINRIRQDQRDDTHTQPNDGMASGQMDNEQMNAKYLTKKQRLEQARQWRTADQQLGNLYDLPELHPPKALLPQVYVYVYSQRYMVVSAN